MALRLTVARPERAHSRRPVWLLLVLFIALAISALDWQGQDIQGGAVRSHAAAPLCHDHGVPCSEADANQGHTNRTSQHSPIACGLALCGSGVIVTGGVALVEIIVTRARSALPGSIILAGQEPEPGRRPPIHS